MKYILYSVVFRHDANLANLETHPRFSILLSKGKSPRRAPAGSLFRQALMGISGCWRRFPYLYSFVTIAFLGGTAAM